jgi:uncharacterized protein (DUF302 family)
MDVKPWPSALPRFGYNARLPGVTLADAKARITAALAEQGFGILTEIDVQATMKKKLDADVAPYVILGACNPGLAKKALTEDPGVGLLLPCNVCLWEEDGATTVSIARPDYFFSIVGNPAIGPIAEEVGQRLQRALAKLQS